jgi:Cu(I)/Ag(I) efflux system membrane protein CusA/SilA
MTNSQRLSILDRIIKLCLENKLVVGLTLFALVGWGILVAPFDWQIPGLVRSPVPVDAIPDIGENQQIVFTEWMGRSPQDVEDQITYPLTVALLGIPEVKTIRSYSFLGFSTIYVIFKEQAEFYWTRSRILEKLNALPSGTLPAGVQPSLGPDATALGQVFWYTLEGRDQRGSPTGGWDLHELRSIQDWYVRYGLMSAEGVAEVASVGGYVQEYQIDVDPAAMREHDIQLQDIFSAVRASNIDVGARTIEVNNVDWASLKAWRISNIQS